MAVAGCVALLVGMTAYLLLTDRGPAQSAADVAITTCAGIAALCCGLAARRGGEQARGWWLLCLAACVWGAGNVVWTVNGLTGDHVHPFPSIADVGYLGYVVPAAAGLFTFPRTAALRVQKLRVVLDALVIATAILFVSWATVLGTVYRADEENLLARLTGIAYPVVDVVMLSLVLALGMRKPPGHRLPWLFLGGGLVVLACTDSTYVSLVFAGESELTGSALVLGWMAAWLLVALAAWAPIRERGDTRPRREFTVGLELIPYVPVFVAVVVASSLVIVRLDDPFLAWNGIGLLLLVAARQVMIVVENVTLTRDLEAKVMSRTSELASLASIVHSSNNAIIGMSLDGVITSWNPAAERLYGFTAAEAVGRSADFLVPSDRLEEEAAILARARRGEALPTRETIRVRKDGSLVEVALTTSAISDGPTARGVSVSGHDITERKLVEAELDRTREMALESARLKSQFLATMSHEIRTPMNGVIGLNDLLLKTPLNETQRQYAEGVHNAGHALLTVINHVLDFSKLEAGRVDLEDVPFDPRRLVEDVAALLAPTAHAKRLELLAYCLPDVPRMLSGDAGRLRQVLLNLASNAVKFTAAGEVVIKVRSAACGDAMAMVGFEVTDTGIGIAAADIGRLFDSFSQADASTTRRYGGTGLGLAISSRLVEAMGGDITVDSELGTGSTFAFEVALPVHPAADRDLLPPTSDVLSDLRVLVVDDNATNRLICQSQLAGWRMRSDAVEDGAAAIVRLRDAAAAGDPYEIAVLDMCMPDMDGLDLARRISADAELVSTKMIMLTSTMHIDADKLHDARIDEWLTKPVRSSAFYDRLMRLMASSAAPATPVSTVVAADPASPASLGRVLVVEDNEVNQMVAQGLVSQLGYRVDMVANGAEALDAVVATAYVAVLMDCHMPVMDGFEATERIRLLEGEGSRIPIIAMTAAVMDEDRARCLAAGMDDFVTKPIGEDEVRRALSRWARSLPAISDASPSDAARPAEADSSSPPIDVKRLAQLREIGPADGWGILPAVVAAYLLSCRELLAAMSEATDTGNARALEESAHQLTGAARNVGATTVAELAHELEELARNGELRRTSHLLNAIEIELDQAASVLISSIPSSR